MWFKDKKANLRDALDTQAILVLFVMAVLFIGAIVINFSNQLSTMVQFQTSGISEVVSVGQNLPGYLDWVYPVVLLVLLIFSMIAAHKIPSDSGYFIVGLLVSPLIAFVIGIMSHLLNAIFSHSTLAIVASQMPITQFMTTPPVPMISGILYLLLVLILLYAGKNE